MIVLKTIPEIPAIPAVIDNVYRVTDMQINFIERSVTFTIQSINPVGYSSPMTPPLSRAVSFDEIGLKVTGPEITAFVAVVRNSLALSMGVTIEKVPPDIFAEI